MIRNITDRDTIQPIIIIKLFKLHKNFYRLKIQVLSLQIEFLKFVTSTNKNKAEFHMCSQRWIRIHSNVIKIENCPVFD